MQINAIETSVELIPQMHQKAEQVVTPQTKTSKTEMPAEQRIERFDKQENLIKLKEVLAEHNISLKFRQDEDTKAMVVELVNDKTGEAIRQIPSEISLKLAAVFVKLQGQFIDTTE